MLRAAFLPGREASRADDQYRTRGPLDHPLCNAPDESMREAGAAMGAHYDEIGV